MECFYGLVESFDAFVRTHLPALRVEQDAKMAHYTSFRIGGARRMAFPRTEEDVERLLSFAGNMRCLALSSEKVRIC